MKEDEPILKDDVVEPEEFDGHDGLIEIVYPEPDEADKEKK
jgi:hypothetical protein